MIVERLNTPSIISFDLSSLLSHCRVSDEFAFEVLDHGKAASTELESYASLALIDQTIRVTMDAWPRGLTFGLPISPLFDPLSVNIKVDGTTFDDFAVTTGLRPAVRLSDVLPCGVIVIEYLAGFGPTRNDVPADLIGAIHDQAAAFFDARGAGDGKSNGMSPHMARIAARYRRVAL